MKYYFDIIVCLVTKMTTIASLVLPLIRLMDEINLDDIIFILIHILFFLFEIF